MMRPATHPYGILRLMPEFSSSGIWTPPSPRSNLCGPMIDYDLLDLPEDLVTRLEAWQARFEEGFDPGSADPALNNPPPEFWDALSAEEKSLAHELHEAVGGQVQYYGEGGIWSVGGTEPDATTEELQAEYEERLAEMQRKFREKPQA